MRNNNIKKSVPATNHNQKGGSVMKKRVFSLFVAIPSLMTVPGVVLANNFVVQDIKVGGNSRDVSINTVDNWTTVREAIVVIPAEDGAHGCVATASADVVMDVPPLLGTEHKYLFTLTRNNNNPVTGNGGAERVLELTDNSGINDPDSKPVATTQIFTNLGPGTHTFRFLGRRDLEATVPGKVTDANISVICVDTP